MSTTTSAPEWDMSVVFPSLESSEFDDAFKAVKVQLADLTTHFDRVQIAAGSRPTELVSTFEKTLHEWDTFAKSFRPVRSFVYSFVTTDAKNDLAQAKLSELQPLYADMAKLWNRLVAWCGTQDVDQLLKESQLARDHEYFLRRAIVLADKQMSPIEEDLAAELTQTGSSAWSRLHGDVTSQITLRVEGEEVPMSVARGMAYDASRATRQQAYEAELAKWKEYDVPLSAAMNAIKGEVGLLARRRGWASPLEHATFEANIDPATLEAMIGAAKDAFPKMREYMRAKAKLIGGGSALDWYDLFAPVGETTEVWEFDRGAEFVAQQFGSYSKKMGDFAQRTFDERWTDAKPKAGKRDGAFCMGLREDESRILMTWKPSFGSVSTLAHELGHAYHNLCLHGRTDIQQDTPMTLAETASIFCETIITQAALDSAPASEKLAILEQSLQRATQTVVDITSRYLFEQEVFERRSERSLSATEYCDLMLWAQSETYGDGLSENRHPYMWAVKPHYYSGGNSFYNFPYMFGMLFSLGLYSVYQQDPERFKGSYDDLLSSTGLADAATLAQRFEIDITTPAFWEGSLHTVATDVDRFVELTK